MTLRIDRFIALFLLAFSIGYGYLAWTHPMLPFEARMPFKPNTMPLGLAGLGVLFSSLLLIFPGEDTPEKDAEGWRGFNWKQAGLLVGLMLAYALLLKPAGFIVATTAFLMVSALMLGERQWVRLALISLIASGVIWYLVDVVLGIYLTPLPELGAL